MPMGTTDQPNSNERMAPAPMATAGQRQVQAPRFPGSDEHGRNPVPPRQEYPGQYHQGDMIPPPGWAGTTNVDEPYLPPDFDRVLVMRCYPEAESTAELRATAYEHGREVLAMARESTRMMAELAGQPDPHDPTQQPPRPGQQPTPPPQPGQQPTQPPQPAQQPNQPQPGREARGQHQDDERERRQLEQAERDRRQHERDDKKNDDKDKK